MPKWKLAAIAGLAVLAIIIVIQNTQAIETKILFVTVTLPRAVLLFVTLLVGFVIGIVSSGRMSRRGSSRDEPKPGKDAEA